MDCYTVDKKRRWCRIHSELSDVKTGKVLPLSPVFNPGPFTDRLIDGTMEPAKRGTQIKYTGKCYVSDTNGKTWRLAITKSVTVTA